MKKARMIRQLFVATAALSLAACASQAPVSNSPKAAVATRAAPSTAAVASKEKDKHVPSGYRRVVKNGVEFFCSRETYTGSRTQRFEQCLTEAQLTALRDSGQDMLRRQQQHVGEQPQAGMGGASPSYGAASMPR